MLESHWQPRNEVGSLISGTFRFIDNALNQPAITCSKFTITTREQRQISLLSTLNKFLTLF